MVENMSSDEVFRRVLSNQRALMEQTQKILAQQDAVKKQQKNCTVEKVPLILKVLFT